MLGNGLVLQNLLHMQLAQQQLLHIKDKRMSSVRLWNVAQRSCCCRQICCLLICIRAFSWNNFSLLASSSSSSSPQVSSLLGDPSRLLVQKALSLRPPGLLQLGKGLLGDSPSGERSHGRQRWRLPPGWVRPEETCGASAPLRLPYRRAILPFASCRRKVTVEMLKQEMKWRDATASTEEETLQADFKMREERREKGRFREIFSSQKKNKQSVIENQFRIKWIASPEIGESFKSVKTYEK